MTVHWRSREELIHQVVVLTAQGMSRRAITRALGVSRNTIKKILRTHGRERDDGHAALAAAPVRAPRSRKIDAYQGRVSELLARYPDITAQRVLEILKDEGFQGGYTAVKKQMRRVRPAAKPTPSLEAPVFGPGEMAENDWSPYTLTYTTGLSETVQLFSYVLVYSKRKSFDVFGSPDLFALMDGHERAFARFGGCAAGCKYDSQKPVVLRWEGHQPIYNPRYLAFGAHYGIQPAAVRGKPNAHFGDPKWITLIAPLKPRVPVMPPIMGPSEPGGDTWVRPGTRTFSRFDKSAAAAQFAPTIARATCAMRI